MGLRVPLELWWGTQFSSHISKISDIAANDEAKAKEIASYIYKLSLLSQKKFSADEMQSFMADSFDILMKL